MTTNHKTAIPRVEDMKRPLKVGELYVVPCIVSNGDASLAAYHGKLCVTPVIDHPHSDRENGQPETHYHADFRFIRCDHEGHPVNKHSKHYFAHVLRPETPLHGKIVHLVLPVVGEHQMNITPVEAIANSKLKHKCIHKGKCPHRGYDLSQVAPINGVITCPLHGLRFDAETGTLLH